MKTITLTLTVAEVRALHDLAETYLAEDGPAYECMPEWDVPHEPAVLTSLRATLLTNCE